MTWVYWSVEVGAADIYGPENVIAVAIVALYSLEIFTIFKKNRTLNYFL